MDQPCIRALAEIVRDVVPGSVVEYDRDGGPDPRSYRADFGRIARALPEFRPRWTTPEGARELYAACGKVGSGRAPRSAPALDG